jgi:hypothetical protein
VEYRVYHNMLWTSFYIFGTCGLAGVLVDLDHLQAFGCSRTAHIPLLVGSCLVLLCYCACLGRLLMGKILGGK